MPGAPDVWLRAVVVDADRDVVLLEAGDGSAPPAPGTRLLGAHGAGDGIRRFDVAVRRHVSGTRARFTVSRPSGFRKVDRRADARVPVRLAAQLVVGGGGEMETISATTVDLSAGGAAVLSPQPLRAGRRLLVLLHLDDDDAILAGAVVAGQQGTVRDEARLGLELQVLDPADRSRLDRHLADLRP
jgi:hypothetical protein